VAVPDFEFPDWIPGWLRWVVLGAGTFGFINVWLQQHGLGRRDSQTKSVIIEQADVVDMAAVRGLTASMQKLSTELANDHAHRQAFRIEMKDELAGICSEIEKLSEGLEDSREFRHDVRQHMTSLEGQVRDLKHHIMELRDAERRRP